MKNPKTTIPGVLTALATVLGLFSQLVPGRWGQYLLTAAIGLGGAATALGQINSQDGSP